MKQHDSLYHISHHGVPLPAPISDLFSKQAHSKVPAIAYF